MCRCYRIVYVCMLQSCVCTCMHARVCVCMCVRDSMKMKRNLQAILSEHVGPKGGALVIRFDSKVPAGPSSNFFEILSVTGLSCMK